MYTGGSSLELDRVDLHVLLQTTTSGFNLNIEN